jgi:hypothetical protein
LIPTKLGDRPLDWKKNPEVAKWLLQNADRIGINLPEELLSQKQELVGMGGAVPSEFNPEGNAARDVYGIAHEVREARARAGQVEEVPRGEGINTPDSIARGRELLKSGADPEGDQAVFVRRYRGIARAWRKAGSRRKGSGKKIRYRLSRAPGRIRQTF